jgi:hypothetical protein
MTDEKSVSAHELLLANVAELDALVEVLARKGLITKAELLAEIRAMKERRLGEGRPGSA